LLQTMPADQAEATHTTTSSSSGSPVCFHRLTGVCVCVWTVRRLQDMLWPFCQLSSLPCMPPQHPAPGALPPCQLAPPSHYTPASTHPLTHPPTQVPLSDTTLPGSPFPPQAAADMAFQRVSAAHPGLPSGVRRREGIPGCWGVGSGAGGRGPLGCC
jgi:hypothetical protein